MTNTSEIHKIFNEEFLGHGIDGIIIQPPYIKPEWIKQYEIAARQVALERLNRESLLLLEEMKDE